MGEKDITEKMLLDYDDVCADLINVLLFEGRRMISEHDLVTIKDKSQYKADGRIHENERDVAKLVRKGHRIIALLGIENMTKGERQIVLRLSGYDGISYGMQYMRSREASRRGRRHGKRKRRRKAAGYPVITVVLYYGLTRWHIHRHLNDILDIDEMFVPFFNDYQIKAFYELAFLSPEQVRMFRSDFRFVADYLVKMRLYGRYEPMEGTVVHIDALVKLMTVITGDPAFERMLPEIRKEKGEVTMEGIWTQAQNQGIKIGEKRGAEKGRVDIYYNEMHLSPEEIADKLGKPIQLIEKYINELAKEKTNEETD